MMAGSRLSFRPSGPNKRSWKQLASGFPSIFSAMRPRRYAHGQMLFNRVDQLRNADGLCKKCMPLDMETTLCLGSCHKRRKKYDWRVVQFTVGLDSRCYFTSIRLWHHDIKQN